MPYHAAEQYQVALSGAGIGVWSLNLETSELECSDTCKTNFGRPKETPFTYEELRGMVHFEDVDRWRSSVETAIRDRSEFDCEYRIIAPGGDVQWVHVVAQLRFDEGGLPTHLSGISQNVTKQKRLQKADEIAKLAQRHLAFAVEASNIGVWHISLPDGKFKANRVLCEHFWKPYEEEPDLNTFFSAMHPDDEERVQDAVSVSMGGSKDYDIEYRVISPTGSIRWIRAIGQTFTDAAGNAQDFSGITWDITEAKAKEKESDRVFEVEQSARQAAELASQMKDDFLMTLSHELRTPLTAILGWTQILKSMPGLNQELQSGLATIERNARSQTRIIEDLLDMSRIISGKVQLDVQTINLASVVLAAIETVRPAADAKGVKLIALSHPDATTINGDPNRLQQVFWNLLSNAVKFTPRGGSVTTDIEFAASRLDVKIKDSGTGIAMDFLPHVFDRFRQADGSMARQHGGLGLGLAIVKQLIELHGGTVDASSAGLGHGSTFSVSLPIAALQSTRILDESRLSGPEADSIEIGPVTFDLTGVTVLLVDDEEESRILMEQLLRSAKADVLSADSVGTGFEQLQQFRPSILVTDIGMPGETGYDLIAKVRHSKDQTIAKIPAIALTAYARAEDRVKALRAGFQLHLAKPVESVELLAAVANLSGKTF